jgi:triacylglycerol lipase
MGTMSRTLRGTFDVWRHVGALALVVGAAGCTAHASGASHDQAAAGDSSGGTGEEAIFGLDAAPLFPNPHGSAARYPIVLVTGFTGSPSPANPWSFHGVADALRADGHIVIEAVTPPIDSTLARARVLGPEVDRALADNGASKVNLIGHSMGGLDIRVLVSELGYGDRVASVTTLSTAHRGTAVADAVLTLMPTLADAAADALGRLWGRIFTPGDVGAHADLRAALTSISEAEASAFNDAHPDDARVDYQSWAGVSSVLGVPNPADAVACEDKLLTYHGRAHVMSAALVPLAPIVAHGALTPNDGMATVDSAKWGTFRGCFPADHLAEVGQPSLEGKNGWTGFDHIAFYRTLAFDLAARGF